MKKITKILLFVIGGLLFSGVAYGVQTQTFINPIPDANISSAGTWNAKITTSSLSSTATGLTYTSNTGVFSWTAGYEGLKTASSTAWNAKQEALVSGTNIKTINSNSLLGSGDLAISASPGGSDTQIQFNNGGAFGADSNFKYSSTTKELALDNGSSKVKIGTVFGQIITPSLTATSTTTGGNTSSTADGSIILDWTTSSTTLNYTGATSTWTVPAGVTSVKIVAYGGSGGCWTSHCNPVTGRSLGGVASGTLAVYPGEVYYYAIGGKSNNDTTAPGWNGGGTGDNAGTGGAGMSWFSKSPTFSTSTVIIVGGGGGGGVYQDIKGGNGGGLVGATGAALGGGVAGTGGTQTAGGVAGGAAGQGGNGIADCAGGGGGGYYGGGGGDGNGCGGQGAAGGGGSSYVSAVATIITADNSTKALSVGGHIIAGGNVPSVSSCGTSPSIAGSDTAGVVSTGSGTVNSCLVTFAGQFYVAPVCVANTASSTNYAVINSVSSSSVTFGFNASYPSKNLYYHCLGY